ncbi:MAG: Rha family transcriptional regulator [Methylobacter sp.]
MSIIPTQNNDLFPETLLVDIADGHTFTTSLKVAEHFQKQHKDVLKAIKKLLADCLDSVFAERNFAPSKYQVIGGKNSTRHEEMYLLTEEGFALLAMGFTGKQALQWKIDFLTAFRSMETALKARVERRANALRYLRPHWLTIEQGVDNGLSRRDLCALTGHRSPDTISANKRRMRNAGLLH